MLGMLAACQTATSMSKLSHPGYILLSLFIVILSALSYLPIYKLNTLHGKSRILPVENLWSEKCSAVKNIHNCFDIALDPLGTAAYISCDPSTFAYLHTLNRAIVLPPSQPSGAIYKYSSEFHIEKLEIHGLPHDFHPLGIAIYSQYLLAINYPNSTVFLVEVFEIQDNSTLLWKESISDPLFNYPNKITIVADQPGHYLASFYLSNTYGLTGPFKLLENKIFGRRGSIVFYNARVKAASQVIWGLDFPSAIEALGDGERLFVSTISAEIMEFRQYYTKDAIHLQIVNNIEIYNPLFVTHSFKHLEIPIDHISVFNSSIYAIGSPAYYLRTPQNSSAMTVIPTSMYKLDVYYDILLQNGTYLRANALNDSAIKVGGAIPKYSVHKILQDDGNIINNGMAFKFFKNGMVIAGTFVAFCHFP